MHMNSKLNVTIIKFYNTPHFLSLGTQRHRGVKVKAVALKNKQTASLCIALNF